MEVNSGNSLNILIDYTASNIGGGKNVAFNQIKHLLDHRSEHTYYLIIKKGNILFNELSNHRKITIIFVEYNNLLQRIFLQLFKFPELIRQCKIDILFCPNNYIWYFGKKVKKIAMHQDAAILQYPFRNLRKAVMLKYGFLRIMSLISIKKADVNIFVSKFIKGKSNGIVIYNGLNIIKKSQLESIKYDFCYIVSNLSNHKNIDRLIESLVLYKQDERKEIRLVIVGGNNKMRINTFKKKIELKGLKEVEITGIIPHNDVFKYLKKSRAYISPTLVESFSIPVFEAYFMDLPLILSDIPIYREFFDQSDIYFNPFKPESIKEKMKFILTNNRKLINEEIDDRIRAMTWENHAKKLIGIFNSYE